MKNRDYKKSSPGSILHIYNRGNNKEKIFLYEQDYRAFLFRLGLCLGFNKEELEQEELMAMPYSRIRITNSNKDSFKIHAFALMPNHFHILIEQLENTSIATFMLKVCTSYAKYLNKKYKRVGHVFQDQFKAVLVENNSQLMWLSAYIHMNPVKDKIVTHPSLYKWSSYNDFILNRNLPLVTTEFLLSVFAGKQNFEKETLNFFKKSDLSKVPFDTSLTF
ncbi:MAG: transposase [Patescibacteria group bacterium]